MTENSDAVIAQQAVAQCLQISPLQAPAVIVQQVVGQTELELNQRESDK